MTGWSSGTQLHGNHAGRSWDRDRPSVGLLPSQTDADSFLTRHTDKP